MPNHYGCSVVAESFVLCSNFSSCAQCGLVQGTGSFPKLTGCRKRKSRAELTELGCRRDAQNALWFLLPCAALTADLLPQVRAHLVMGVDLFWCRDEADK